MNGRRGVEADVARAMRSACQERFVDRRGEGVANRTEDRRVLGREGGVGRRMVRRTGRLDT